MGNWDKHKKKESQNIGFKTRWIDITKTRIVQVKHGPNKTTWFKVTWNKNYSIRVVRRLTMGIRVSKLINIGFSDGFPLLDIYLIVTRPNISYVVHHVSQFMYAPQSIHYVVS